MMALTSQYIYPGRTSASEARSMGSSYDGAPENDYYSGIFYGVVNNNNHNGSLANTRALSVHASSSNSSSGSQRVGDRSMRRRENPVTNGVYAQADYPSTSSYLGQHRRLPQQGSEQQQYNSTSFNNANGSNVYDAFYPSSIARGVAPQQQYQQHDHQSRNVHLYQQPQQPHRTHHSHQPQQSVQHYGIPHRASNQPLPMVSHHGGQEEGPGGSAGGLGSSEHQLDTSQQMVNFRTSELHIVRNMSTRRRRRTIELDRKFVCAQQNCGRRYASQSALYAHMRIKHKILRGGDDKNASAITHTVINIPPASDTNATPTITMPRLSVPPQEPAPLPSSSSPSSSESARAAAPNRSSSDYSQATAASPSSLIIRQVADNTPSSSVQLEDDSAKKGDINGASTSINSSIKNADSRSNNNINKNDSHHHSNTMMVHETCLGDPARRSVTSPPPSWQIRETLSSPPLSPKNRDESSVGARTLKPKSGTVTEPEAFKYLSEADCTNLLNEDRDRHYMRFSTLQRQHQTGLQEEPFHRQQLVSAVAPVSVAAPLYDMHSQDNGIIDQPISSKMASALTTPHHHHHHDTVAVERGNHHHMIIGDAGNIPRAHTTSATISRTTGAAAVADSIVGGSGVPFSLTRY